jgi:hypothetical protein
MIKSGRISWTVLTAPTPNLDGKLDGRRPLGSAKHKCEGNIKIYPKGI